MPKKPADITCAFCDGFLGAIGKRNDDGKIIKFCPRNHCQLERNHVSCLLFQPASYFFCTDREMRTSLFVCKERRNKKHCPKKCAQARIVDAIDKMEDTHELVSTTRTKSEFQRIDMAANLIGNSPDKETTKQSTIADTCEIRRIHLEFNRVPLSQSDEPVAS